MRIAELARRAGVPATAIRWYEHAGVLPQAPRGDNGYRDYADDDVARLRLVVSLRRLGLGPEDAGRLARLCLERGAVDLDLAPLLAQQRAAIARQREDLDRLEAELLDLEAVIAAAGRQPRRTAPMAAPIRVLFVCTGNSARSQLAEALLARMGGTDFEVQSAGTEPKGVNPYAVRVLASMGIDWSGATSKALQGFLGQDFDYVITVCDRARQACPVFPGVQDQIHWGLEDPAEVEGTDAEKLAAFEQTAKDLTMRIRPFVEVALRASGRAPRPAARLG